MMITFGPVPSRRLGYSLGINHIPPKHCSYACVYCQVGSTSNLKITRREFFQVKDVVVEVENSIRKADEKRQNIDFLTLVPDGEPTLDIHLGELIRSLKQFNIPIAVISNASLIDQQDVQEDLLQADWVSVKVDSVHEATWHKINRSHGSLNLPNILNGILEFRRLYKGELVTETMLVSGINDSEDSISQLVDFLLELQPFKSYLSIPTRPPAESWVKPPHAGSLQRMLDQIDRKCTFIDLLFDYEPDDFTSTGNLAEDILSIAAVHPIRETALRRLVKMAGQKWSSVELLLRSGELTSVTYQGETFFLNRDS